MEWQEEYGSSPATPSSTSTLSPPEPVVQPEQPALAPKPLARNRRNTPSRERKAGPNSLIPPLTREPSQGEIVNQVIAPFSLKGELSKRSIILSPDLPEYPKWAELAAVELRLTVTLSIDEKGIPYEVFISKSSGDSQTDLKVLRYTENLRFEPSLSKSHGKIQWSFELSK